jgi:L-fuculose-phosphate aldolase
LRKSLRPDVNAYLLRNHGVVCCGSSLVEAVVRVEALETACSDYFRNAIAQRQASAAEAWVTEALELLVRNKALEKEL